VVAVVSEHMSGLLRACLNALDSKGSYATSNNPKLNARHAMLAVVGPLSVGRPSRGHYLDK